MVTEVVSTVFVAGLPADATARELDNLCRFMPGFVDSKVDYRKGTTLFALFQVPEQAKAAIALLNGEATDRRCPGEPMRAVLARSNMRSDTSWATVGQPPPPLGTPALTATAVTATAPVVVPQSGGNVPTNAGSAEWTLATAAAGAKRPRIPEDPGHVDTLASVGALEAGFDEAALEGFFALQPGFLAFKGNPRMGGGFAKFESAALAASAVAAAMEQGVPAEMAKSSMGWTPAPTAAAPTISLVQAAGAPPPGAGKRPRIPEDPGEVDTVASVGALEAGFDEASLQAFFALQPGFVCFKPNPRMGGGFAKFEAAPLAANAVAAAWEQGVPAEMARSSMGAVATNPVQPTWTAQPAAPVVAAVPAGELQGGPRRPRIPEDPNQVDTVACIGANEAGYDENSLREFFAALPGFVTFKANARMGGGFAKFTSHAQALDCVATGEQNGVPVSIAKSSMSTVS